MNDPRRIAYNLILEWQRDQTFPNLALKKWLRNVREERDRRFVSALVYGVIERKITLDHFISKCSERKLSSLSLPVLTVLRMGVYQMFYMQVPSSAACNTSVELIKKQGDFRSSGFVNAVLRSCDRNREELLMLKKADYSVRYSINPALVELLLEQYGKEAFVSMMEGIMEADPSVYLFHNIKRGTEDEFLSALENEGIILDKTDLLHLFKAKHGFDIEASPAYRGGWYHVVGYHSAKAALMIPSNCQNALDLCAAPGGKSFILAAQTNGTVRSFDIYPHKIDLLKQSSRRLGHTNISFAVADAAKQQTELVGFADFVLCDVPCSGMGMIGRKPDIKYKEFKDNAFPAMQYPMLENGASYLKNGGRLVYSTCTIDRRENEWLIQAFLNKHPEFSLDSDAIPNGNQTYLPGNEGDGFYIAVLKKGNSVET